MSAPAEAEPSGALAERPLLTPDDHTDQPLTPCEWKRRAALLARVRDANRRYRR